MIDCSLVGKEGFQYWKYVFDVVESDGYVTDRYNVCGAISPELTEKGRIFFDLGGNGYGLSFLNPFISLFANS